MARWTKEEESLLINYLDKYGSVEELPLASLTDKLGRTVDAIRRKASRLVEASNDSHEWTSTERKEAFSLYLEEKSVAEIRESLSHISLDHIEQELKRLRNAWTQHMRAYAEERGLPTAKHFKLETIGFYIENRLTEKDFIRKVLHGKIKNG
jgi:hypothetical protein